MAWLDLIVNGMCNGIGTAIGSYLAVRYAVSHVPRVEDHVKRIRGRVREELYGGKE
jgi:hypothetical protein